MTIDEIKEWRKRAIEHDGWTYFPAHYTPSQVIDFLLEKVDMISRPDVQDCRKMGTCQEYGNQLKEDMLAGKI